MFATRFSPEYKRNGLGAMGEWGDGWRQRWKENRGAMVEPFEIEDVPTPTRRNARIFRRSRSRSQKRAQRSRSRGGSQRRAEEDEKAKGGSKTLKFLGLGVSLTSATSISLAISNIAVTASTVLTSSSSSGCFEDSEWYEALGPKNQTMTSWDWSWVTVGLWSAILTYLAGLLAGKVTKERSSLYKFVMFCAIFSLLAFIPLRLIFAILDSLLSSACGETNTPKLVLPIGVAAISALEFLLLLIILLRLRKQAKKWKNEKNDRDADDDDAVVTRRRQPKFEASNNPFVGMATPAFQMPFYNPPAMQLAPNLQAPPPMVMIGRRVVPPPALACRPVAMRWVQRPRYRYAPTRLIG